MCDAWDCVAKSGSRRSRLTGYSAVPAPIGPRSLSTSATRTLCVPKSTPATTATLVSRSGVPQHVPAQVTRRRLVHGVGDRRHGGRDVVLEAVRTDEAQQFLEPRNLGDTGAAERRQRIVGESSLADIAADLAGAIVGREPGVR